MDPLTLTRSDDVRELLRWGFRWRAYALDLEAAAAPWAGDE